MIAVVSIILHLVALCFAAMFGTMAEKDHRGVVVSFHGRFIASLTVVFFVLASILQVVS